jgi:hypothetical protein
LRRLNLSRFVAVVGTSGSGKSSLVRAGVIPALYGDFLEDAGSHWRTAVFRPGEDPISSLGDSLHALFPRATSAEEEKFQRKMLETTLRRGSTGLVTAVHQANLPTLENLLVVVDQFEELFRFTKAIPRPEVLDVAAAFVKLLLEAAQAGDVRVYIIVTLRSDFIGDCSQFRDLPEAVNEGLYLIPRLTRDQLREAIVGPAAMFGAKLTPGLIQELLNDVEDDQDQLPLLQHALMRTWKGRDLIEQDYRETGGMAAALDKHAEEVFDELPDQRHRDVAKQLFQSITDKGPDNREVRRPTTVGDVCAIAEASEEEVGKVIECFRAQDRAFLMPPLPEALHSDRLVDVSHESLIRKWKRLRLWVEEEAQSRETCLRIANAALRFEANQAGLLRDPELELALKWWKAKNPSSAWGGRCSDRFSLVLPFLKRSELNRNEEIAAKEKQAQRQIEIARQHAREQAQAATRLRRIAWVLLAVTVFAIGAAVYAGVMQRQAQRNASLAQAGRLELLAKDANLEAYELDLKGAEVEADKLWTRADKLLSDAHKLTGIQTTYLTVKSEPGSYIFVDGESRSKVGSAGESRSLVLSSGMHTVRVTKKEFEPFEENNRTFPPGTLPPLIAPLKRVTFAPEFTDAYLEGKKYWSAPESWQVREGKLLVSGVGIGLLRDLQGFRSVFRPSVSRWERCSLDSAGRRREELLFISTPWTQRQPAKCVPNVQKPDWSPANNQHRSGG